MPKFFFLWSRNDEKIYDSHFCKVFKTCNQLLPMFVMIDRLNRVIIDVVYHYVS